jgi:signal peptidase I
MFQIPSESMEPTLDVGQRVLVGRVSAAWALGISERNLGLRYVF